MTTKRRNGSLAAAVGLAALLIASIVRAGAGGGEPASIEPDLRAQIESAFMNLGMYFEPFDAQLKAFLWENRAAFDASSVQEDRVVEAALCVLITRYGYDNFGSYSSSDDFRTWCAGLLEGA